MSDVRTASAACRGSAACARSVDMDGAGKERIPIRMEEFSLINKKSSSGKMRAEWEGTLGVFGGCGCGRCG